MLVPQNRCVGCELGVAHYMVCLNTATLINWCSFFFCFVLIFFFFVFLLFVVVVFFFSGLHKVSENIQQRRSITLPAVHTVSVEDCLEGSQ